VSAPHIIKARTLTLHVDVTCDGCQTKSKGKIFIRTNFEGLVAEVSAPDGWTSIVSSAPEHGADGDVLTNDFCPTCVIRAKAPEVQP